MISTTRSSEIFNYNVPTNENFKVCAFFGNNAEPITSMFGRHICRHLDGAGQLRHDDQACLELHRPTKCLMEIPSHLVLQDPMGLTVLTSEKLFTLNN
jgi:hypothetical protein